MKRDEWILGILLYSLILLAANSGPLAAKLEQWHWDRPLFAGRTQFWTVLVPRSWGAWIEHWTARVQEGLSTWASFGRTLMRSGPSFDFFFPGRSRSLAHGKVTLPDERRNLNGKEPQKG
ncbi:MAG TPA: hypothetical protein VHE12_13260 [bacterium]|nr:hypothetical protein [bacterium]